MYTNVRFKNVGLSLQERYARVMKKPVLFLVAFFVVTAGVVDTAAAQKDGGVEVPTDSAATLTGGGDAVTVADVVGMQARLPAESRPHGKAAGFDRAGEAKLVAKVIAQGARSRLEAALAATYGAYESSYLPKAEGDKRDGVYHSFGVFQLNESRASRECAFDVECAFKTWQRLYDDAQTRCGRNPPEERLAVIASGSCDFARTKVRVRYQIAKRIAAMNDEEEESLQHE